MGLRPVPLVFWSETGCPKVLEAVQSCFRLASVHVDALKKLLGLRKNLVESGSLIYAWKLNQCSINGYIELNKLNEVL